MTTLNLQLSRESMLSLCILVLEYSINTPNRSLHMERIRAFRCFVCLFVCIALPVKDIDTITINKVEHNVTLHSANLCLNISVESSWAATVTILCASVSLDFQFNNAQICFCSDPLTYSCLHLPIKGPPFKTIQVLIDRTWFQV